MTAALTPGEAKRARKAADLRTRVLHQELLERYGRILVTLQGLRFVLAVPLGPPPSSPLRRLWSTLDDGFRFARFALRPLTQPYVEAHIAKRLDQLDRIYLYGATAGGLDPDWAKSARAEMQVVRGTLRPWTSLRSLAQLLGAPVIGIAVALAGGDDVYDAVVSLDSGLAQAALAVAFLAIYGGLFLASGFAFKRALFLAAGPVTAAGDEEPRNTYWLENALWSQLGVGRKPEPRFDEGLYALYGIATMAIAIAGFVIADVLWLRLVWAAAIAVYAGMALAAVRRARTRIWR